MIGTKIQWCDATINPLVAVNKETLDVGHFCIKVSPGCTNCYASDFNTRVRRISVDKPGVGTGLPFLATNAGKVDVRLREDRLNEVRRRKKPTTYFWADMTDMFADLYPDYWIDRIVACIAETSWHRHIVLTKRAERLYRYFSDPGLPERISQLLDRAVSFPLSNLVISVSAENQECYDERSAWLLATPAACRMVSFEPLLGPVVVASMAACRRPADGQPERLARFPDWMIIGGESVGGRPCELAWIECLVREARIVGARAFVKQLGSNPVVRSGHIGYERTLRLADRKGGDMDEFPESLRVRQLPDLLIR